MNEIISKVKPNVIKYEELDSIYRIGKNIYSTGFMQGKVDEQSLILDTKKGLIIITGCAHPGKIEIVKRVKAFSAKPIYMLLEKFHMATPDMTEEKNIGYYIGT